MKSAIFSVIPLVGFALAQKDCTRRTVTKTETEREYVTVQPADITSTYTKDVTITSTIDITTTITVRPSSVEASSTGLHWGNYPNGTWNNPTGSPQPILSTGSLTYTPSAITETPAPTSAPSEIAYPTGEVGNEYEIASETAVPTSETRSSSAYVAPAASSTSQAAQAQATSSAAGSKRGEATFYGGNTSGGTW